VNNNAVGFEIYDRATALTSFTGVYYSPVSNVQVGNVVTLINCQLVGLHENNCIIIIVIIFSK
jgi:hypothetical protein